MSKAFDSIKQGLEEGERWKIEQYLLNLGAAKQLFQKVSCLMFVGGTIVAISN